MAFLEKQDCTAKVSCDVCGKIDEIGINTGSSFSLTGGWDRKTFYVSPADGDFRISLSDICADCDKALLTAVQTKLAELRSKK